MNVKNLKELLDKCDENDEIIFIYDENTNTYRDLGNGLKEIIGINVTGKKINGKIALTNGRSCQLLKGNEKSIIKVD